MSYNISKSPEDVLIINLLLYSINVSKFSKNFTICNEAVGVLITELRKMQKMNQKLSSLENELRVKKNNLEHNGSISNTNPVKNKPCDTMWSILQMLWKNGHSSAVMSLPNVSSAPQWLFKHDQKSQNDFHLIQNEQHEHS